MEHLKSKELIEFCEELGLTLGHAKRKQRIFEIMKNKRVMAEQGHAVWADIKTRSEEAGRREIREFEDAERLECLVLKRM